MLLSSSDNGAVMCLFALVSVLFAKFGIHSLNLIPAGIPNNRTSKGGAHVRKA